MQDRRAYPRLVVPALHSDMSPGSHVEIQNFSVGGMAAELDKRLSIGGEYPVRLGIQDRAMALRGVVARCALKEIRRDREQALSLYSVGVRFSDALSERITEILDFLGEFRLVAERRAGGVRVEVDAPGRLIGDPRSHRVRTINASGTLIEAEKAMEVGAVHAMEVLLKDDEPLPFIGRVVRCTSASRSVQAYAIAVMFLQLSAKDTTRFKQFLQTQAPPSARG